MASGCLREGSTTWCMMWAGVRVHTPSSCAHVYGVGGACVGASVDAGARLCVCVCVRGGRRDGLHSSCACMCVCVHMCM